jgi:hypothetical protein
MPFSLCIKVFKLSGRFFLCVCCIVASKRDVDLLFGGVCVLLHCYYQLFIFGKNGLKQRVFFSAFTN